MRNHWLALAEERNNKIVLSRVDDPNIYGWKVPEKHLIKMGTPLPSQQGVCWVFKELEEADDKPMWDKNIYTFDFYKPSDLIKELDEVIGLNI